MSNRSSSNKRSQGDRPKEKKSIVYVRRMVEELFPVEIDLNAPVKTLKEEIEKQKGIKTENQLVDFAGVSLKDDQPLSALGIQDSSYLHVMEKTRSRGWITIFVKTPKNTFPISLCAQSRLHNLQWKLSDLLGVHVKQQRILVDGRLQTNISEKLETFGHGSTVELHLPKHTNVTVFNTNDESRFCITVDDFETVHSVKMRIFDSLRIIPSAQWILNEDVPLEDDVLMREYDVTKDSLLKLYENKDEGIAIEVIVKLPSEKEIVVKTDLLKSVYSVMKHIEENEGIPYETQQLYLKEHQLLEWKSLAECNITNGTQINLFRSSDTEIVVMKLTGQSWTLLVDLNVSISIVKEKVEVETGIPADNQRLIYAGKQLEDKCTLGSYYVQKGSTLHLVTRCRGC